MLRIKTSSPEAIFYHSQRISESGKILTMYKFRTMIIGADQHDQPRINVLKGDVWLAIGLIIRSDGAY